MGISESLDRWAGKLSAEFKRMRDFFVDDPQPQKPPMISNEETVDHGITADVANNV